MTLTLALCLIAFAGTQDPPAVRTAEIPWNPRTVEHLLNRAAFGARIADVERGMHIGPEALVDELLAEDGAWEAVEPTLFRWEDFGLDHRQMPLPEAPYNALPSAEQTGMCKDARHLDRERYFELVERFFHSMIAHRAPLRDRMTLFWHGFFTTSLDVNKRKFELIHQFQWLRRNALGSYAELLRGIVRDPAMLQYLDNTSNYAEHPNENLARELMELYSLGEGSYTESDVREAARALTGYAGGADGTFEFLAVHHDGGEKTILGVTGEHGADELVDILLSQEACAEWVARRLLRSLEGVEPGPERLADYAAFLFKGDYEVRPFLRRLFLDPEFYRAEIVGAGVSAPLEFLVGVCRKLDLLPPGAFLNKASAVMGQGLYLPPSVKGWPEGLAWMTNDAMMRRGDSVGVMLGVVVVEPPAYDVRPAVAAREGGGMQGAGMDDGGDDLMLFHMREILRVEEWLPRWNTVRELRRAQVRTDRAIARRLLEEWLAIPPSDASRELAAALLAGERERHAIPDGELLDHPREADRALRSLAHLVFSLPEAQLR